jgi:hypothetical protein
MLMMLDDSNVHNYTPGQSVSLYHQIVAPHTGTANVSIVKVPDNKILAADLKKWDTYASTSTPIESSQENFTITIPKTLGSTCASAGHCVIQMHWDAASINQTYQSCIDITVSDGSAKAKAKGRRGFFGLWGSEREEEVEEGYDVWMA